MGLNVDLTQMLRVPDKVECPKCKRMTDTYAEDYDIECGNPNPEKGKWSLSICCGTCGCDFKLEFEVQRKNQKTVPE